MGAQWVAATVNPAHETRDSSETSFLAAAAGRPNLHVFNGTMAKKILFTNTAATGVQVESKGVITKLQAKKEVIVSGGAFHSPQLLMVSGIGPEEALHKLKIPVLANRPGVGTNMQDHVFFGPSYRVNVPTVTKLATVSGCSIVIQFSILIDYRTMIS
jgi:choline dehydrogenase-like flavoprotein